MAENRRQQIIDWLRNSGNPESESLLKSLYQMNTDEWEQKNRKDLRKIMGYADLEKSTVSLRDRARGEFDSYVDNPEWYIKGKAAKLGVNIEDLRKALSELEEERKWEEGRERRAQEVNDGFVWNFAPESSKRRYIDDPNTTLFGKEGNFNPLSTEGARDIRDVALGGIGLAGDFIPGYGAAVGPIARGVRNATLMAEGSPYAPSTVDAGKELINDAATYGAAAWLQNFRKAKRLAAGAQKDVPFLGDINKNARTTNLLDETNKGLLKVNYATNYDNTIKAIEDLPDSEIKSSLMNKIAAFEGVGDKKAEEAFARELQHDAHNFGLDMWTTLHRSPEGWVAVAPNETKATWIKNSVDENGSLILPSLYGEKRGEEAIRNMKSFRKMARSTPTIGKAGQFIRDVVYPIERNLEQGAAKNATSLYKAKPAEEERAKIDWYKANYARDWDMGFEPKGKESDPIVKAYKEYIAEKEMNRQTPRIEDIF